MITFNSLKLKVTLRCNNDCKFCNLRNAEYPDMNIEFINLICNRLRQIHFRKIKINGGEPTIHENIVDIVSTLSNKYPDSKIVLGTNGKRLLNKKIITILDNIDILLLSCDDEHNNYDIIPDILKVCNKKRIHVIIQTVSNYIVEENKQWLQSLISKYNCDYSESEVVNYNTCQPNISETNWVPCTLSSFNELIVMPNGDVHLCCKKNLLGLPDSNISSSDLNLMLSYVNQRKYPECEKCSYYSPLVK